MFLPEAGGHKWQRVPETEKRGRTQSSTITVSVLSIKKNINVQINPKDLEWDYFNGEGGGGQHRNKVAICVRLKHIPTGITAVAQSERSLDRNKKQALQLLESKLQNIEEMKQHKSRKKTKKKQVGIGCKADKIRTYRYQDDIVTNHLNGNKASLKKILSGNLDILR